MDQNLRTYRQSRRKFATLVYSLAFILCALAIVQWIMICQIDAINNYLVEHSFLAPTFLVISLILITVFVFFENLRFIVPINLIIALIIVELVVWAAGRVAIAGDFTHFVISCFVVAILVIVMLCIGSYIRHDMTLDILVLCVLSAIFVVISVILLMIFLVTYMQYVVLIYAVIGTFVVSAFIAYHAQTINGGHYAEMRLDDFLLAALILFHDYVILLMAFYYVESRISKHYFENPFDSKAITTEISYISTTTELTTTELTTTTTTTTRRPIIYGPPERVTHA